MTFDWHWPAFFTRVTAGLLFAVAGVHKVFIMTPQVHARKLFLEPDQHTWIPHFLLWSLGLGILFIDLIAGWLLVAGLLRRPVAISLGFLLLIVTYGHALMEPLFNVNSHIFPRLIVLLPTLALSTEADPWSFDAVRSRRRASKMRD
jgi:putative oxidoreductase